MFFGYSNFIIDFLFVLLWVIKQLHQEYFELPLTKHLQGEYEITLLFINIRPIELFIENQFITNQIKLNLNQNKLKLQFKDNNKILQESDLPDTFKINLNVGIPDYTIHINTLWNLKTNENIYVYRGLIKHNVINNILYLPDFDFIDAPIQLILSHFNLLFKEKWAFYSDVMYEYNTHINSIYDLQKILDPHFWSIMEDDKLLIVNKSEHFYHFNNTFKKYCKLYSLHHSSYDGEQLLSLQPKQIELNVGEQVLPINVPPSINSPYQLTVDHSDQIKIKLFNKLLNQPIEKSDILDNSSIHLTACQVKENGKYIIVTIKT